LRVGVAEMPFPHHTTAVAFFAKYFGQRNFGRRQRFLPFCGQYGRRRVSSFTNEEIGQMMPGRMNACKQARAGGRTNGGGSVGLRELHASLCQPIDVRCLIEWVSIATQVSIAEIVCEN